MGTDVLNSPLELCLRLGQRPTRCQQQLLERIAACSPLLQEVGDARCELHRAVALGVLWRLLSTPGALGVVLSSAEGLGDDFMAFLRALTEQTRPMLASAITFPRPDVLKIGYLEGNELRILPCRRRLIVARGSGALVSVVLGAKSSDPAFVEALEMLDGLPRRFRHSRIEVW